MKSTTNTEPERPYSQYGVGQKFDGEIIAQIFSSHRDFLIYRVKNTSVVVFYYYDQGTDYKENISKIAHKVAKQKSFINDKFTRRKFNSRIALAFREALLGNDAVASDILDKVIEEAHPFKKNLANIFYLASCFNVVFILAIFAVLQDIIFKIDYFNPIIKVMLFSSMGGFISVSLSLKNLDLNYDFYNWSQGVYGSIRILTAIISGVIAFVLIKSGFVLSNLDQNNDYVFYSLAIVAGFSEKWIPNTLNKIGKDKK